MIRVKTSGVWRSIPAAVAALALALVLTHSAGAATKIKGTVKVSAQEYANICDDYGASDIKVGKNNQGHTTVSCGWSDGTTSVCDFKTHTCDDTVPMIAPHNPLPDVTTAINAGDAQPVSTPTPAPMQAAMGG